MGRVSSEIGIAFVLVLVLSLIVACGGSGDNGTVENGGDVGDDVDIEREDVTITIGNLTDKSGPTANALSIMDMGLQDMVKYFNDENLIPGIELKVIEYDAQYDPSKHIPGYEWLKERGSDVIYSSDPNAIETLKSRVDKDQIVTFASNAQAVLLEKPGYAFTAGTYPVDLYYTFLDWIADNDWDYATNGPAKIGMAGWTTAINVAMTEGMEGYCNEHPDRFEWAGEYLIDMGFNWGHEVEALKDCDYVLPPVGSFVTFVKQYKDIGGRAKFFGADPHAAFFSLISDAQLWVEIDGMLIVRESDYWNEEGELINLAKQLLHENHPDSAQKIMRSGVSYMVTYHHYILLEIIKNAVEAVGPENIDSQAIYEAAQSYSLTIDGVQRFSFTDTKRFGCDNVGIYEANGAEETIFRVDSEWIPMIWVR
ncbi:MAG: ABC transporter substrate-binding protein [Chloroflexi bacterium]|nr:ABC transporter substrate-binding protein [Chloroflexota bacterium]